MSAATAHGPRTSITAASNEPPTLDAKRGSLAQRVEHCVPPRRAGRKAASGGGCRRLRRRRGRNSGCPPTPCVQAAPHRRKRGRRLGLAKTTGTWQLAQRAACTRSCMEMPQRRRESAGSAASRGACANRASFAHNIGKRDAQAGTRCAERQQRAHATHQRQSALDPSNAPAAHGHCATRRSWTPACEQGPARAGATRRRMRRRPVPLQRNTYTQLKSLHLCRELRPILDRSGVDRGRSVVHRCAMDPGSRVRLASTSGLGSVWGGTRGRSGVDLRSIWLVSGVDVESTWVRSEGVDLGSIGRRSVADPD